MTEPEATSDEILDWIEGSLSYHPSFYPYSLDNLCTTGALNNGSWLDILTDIQPRLVGNDFTSINHNSDLNTTAATVEPFISNHQLPPETSKKRKASDETNLNASQAQSKNQNRRSNEADDGDKVAVDHRASVKKAELRASPRV